MLQMGIDKVNLVQFDSISHVSKVSILIQYYCRADVYLFMYVYKETRTNYA